MTDLVLEIVILLDQVVYNRAMREDKAFNSGRGVGVRLPEEAGIRPGDAIVATVVGPGKVLIELDLPDYRHFLPKRSAEGGQVTTELVARLLGLK